MFTENKNLLCVSSRRVYLMNFEKMSILREYHHHFLNETTLSCAKRIPHTNRFISGCLDGSLHLWDIDTVYKIFSTRLEFNPIIDIYFLPTSSKFVTISEDVSSQYILNLNVCNINYNSVYNQYDCNFEKYIKFSNCNRASMFNCECLCGKEDVFLTNSFVKTSIIKKNLTNDQCLKLCDEQQIWIMESISKDLLAVGHIDGSVNIWNVSTNKIQASLKFEGLIKFIALMTDDVLLICSSDLNLCNLCTNQIIKTIRIELENTLKFLKLTPYLFAILFHSNKIEVWNTYTGLSAGYVQFQQDDIFSISLA